MGGRVLETGDFWIVTDDPGGGEESPFAGLPTEYVQALEELYRRYCNSVKSQEVLLRIQGEDLDNYLVEGKFGGWSSKYKRDRHGKRIRGSDHYKRVISKETHAATNQTRKLISSFRDSLERLVSGYRRGRKKMATLRREASELFKRHYQSLWDAGRRASGILAMQKLVAPPDKKEEKWFRDSIREELAYWNGFLDELERDKEWKGRPFTVPERITMFAETSLFMFQTGRMSGMPDAVLLHWYPKDKKTGKMCPGCAFMVDNSPYPRDMMPTVPRAGDTPCLMRCVHKVVVRYVTPSQVQKRREALGSRDSLRRDLLKFMRKSPRKKRGRGQSYNPWLGKKYGELK
jgi:hypothetical protein